MTWLLLLLALNVGFILGAWWASRLADPSIQRLRRL
jgi:uncharacterized membrane-anchored protein YhcB (DUF1043 family)